MTRGTMVRVMTAVAVAAARPGAAQDSAAADSAIAARLMAEVQPHRTPRVVLWAQLDALPEEEARAFAQELDAGVAAIERLTGERLDRAHYGDSVVHVFVSGRVTVSHVYGGYAHPRYTRPYLYLNPQRVRRRAAPYLHELTHIVLWRFGSHSLREGFASYVEGRLAEEGVGYNSGVFGPGPRAEVDSAAADVLSRGVGTAVLPWIGRSGATDPSITNAEAPEMRSAFYLLTRSFVQHLLDEIDIPTFIRLYRAEDTEAAYRELTGRSLEEWRASWTRALGT
ncbi:MAG TPA: hypothetical protein VHG08_18660 [Longimicrobium sp.]|nr:hypothetical protein [Longimicrobium sp.]